MKLNWDELQKGDKLYLLVPMMGEHCIIYKYQESQVINLKIHSKYKSVSIRFKYTDAKGKRIRIETEIRQAEIEKDYLVVGQRYSSFNDEPIYGKIIIVHDNPEQLDNIHHRIIHNEIEKLQVKIDEFRKNMNYLENQKYVSIINR